MEDFRLEDEEWRQSRSRDIWWVSNFGRVRGNGRSGAIHKIVYDDLIDDWVVLARGTGRWYRVRELFEECWGPIVDISWRPWLSRKVVRRSYNKSRVYCSDLHEWYDSVADAARKLGISESAIRNVVNGDRTHAFGYHFIRECDIVE